MPIVQADIQRLLTGGASNTNANLSLGGAVSSTAAADPYFDGVSSAEAAAGDAEYRCIAVKNNHGTLTLQSPKLWIDLQATGGDNSISVGLGASGVSGTETAIADENTAPAGVTFSAPTTKGAGISAPNLAPGQWVNVWIRRSITAGAAATAVGSPRVASWRFEGDTAA